MSSLSSNSAVIVSGSAQSLSVRAWFRCVLQQHLHKNPDGSDSRTGKRHRVYNVIYKEPSVGKICVYVFLAYHEIQRGVSQTVKVGEFDLLGIREFCRWHILCSQEYLLQLVSHIRSNFYHVRPKMKCANWLLKTPNYAFLLTYSMFVPAWLLGRAMEEQLYELTRLVLRLPEVDSLLQRAGLQSTATRPEPTTVLEMFVKVTWCEILLCSVYGVWFWIKLALVRLVLVIETLSAVSVCLHLNVPEMYSTQHILVKIQICTTCDACLAYRSLLWQLVFTWKYFHTFIFLSAFSWRQAVGSVYSGLQILSERSAMVTRALDYIGDIMKHIKPSLISKNPEGLQLVYWAVGRCRACILQTHYTIGAASWSHCFHIFTARYESQTVVRSHYTCISDYECLCLIQVA